MDHQNTSFGHIIPKMRPVTHSLPKMEVVLNLKGETIAKFSKYSIMEGSAIQSDAYRSYRKPL